MHSFAFGLLFTLWWCSKQSVEYLYEQNRLRKLKKSWGFFIEGFADLAEECWNFDTFRRHQGLAFAFSQSSSEALWEIKESAWHGLRIVLLLFMEILYLSQDRTKAIKQVEEDAIRHQQTNHQWIAVDIGHDGCMLDSVWTQAALRLKKRRPHSFQLRKLLGLQQSSWQHSKSHLNRRISLSLHSCLL